MDASRLERKYLGNLLKIDFATASRAYLELREIYPWNPQRKEAETVTSTEELIENHDAFICDGYGVLNFGQKPVSFMPGVIAAMKRAGKPVRVLTNGASFDGRHMPAKYRAFGYEFDRDSVFSSRDLAVREMEGLFAPDEKIGTTLTDGSEPERLPFKTLRLGSDVRDYEEADAFLFLSSGDWNYDRQKLLTDSLKRKPRRLFVANPDVCAPFVGWNSAEPGYFAYLAWRETGIVPEFFGKPFPAAYERVFEGLKRNHPAIERERVLMIGDTPFTDIMGANNAGFKTLLMVSHGFLRETDVNGYLETCQIHPDYVLE